MHHEIVHADAVRLGQAADVTAPGAARRGKRAQVLLPWTNE